jgi:soluble lytic murein transglycosylase
VVDDLLDPELNVRYGSWYLRHLLDKYGDERLALAAYNAGQANVDRWREDGVGIQFPETRHYVRRVQELKAIYARAYPAELGLD